MPAGKNDFFFHLLNEKKRNSLRLATLSAQNPGFLLIIIQGGKSDKVILHVSIAVFRALLEMFSG